MQPGKGRGIVREAAAKLNKGTTGMKYCSNCGADLDHRIPDGEDRLRYVCDTCDNIHYQNPKMVVGTVPRWEDKILLCRRAIAPRYGFWTLPAGYLENGETTARGARRETFEETGARLGELTPFALFDMVFVGEIYYMFTADMVSPEFHVTDESLEVALFTEEQIPWGEIAFDVIEKTLRCWFEDLKTGRLRFHTGEIERGRKFF